MKMHINYKFLNIKLDKMYYKFLKLVFIAGIVCTFSSCTKDLDLRPTDAVDASKAYTNMKDRYGRFIQRVCR